jgi:hypothetical protein
MFDHYTNRRFKPLVQQLCNSSSVIGNLRNWLETVQKTKRRFSSTLFLYYSRWLSEVLLFKCEMPDPNRIFCKVRALFFTVENKSRSCLHERERYGCSYICFRMQSDGHLLFESCLRSLCAAGRLLLYSLEAMAVSCNRLFRFVS